MQYLAPLSIQVMLTFFLLIMMAILRLKAVATGKVRSKDVDMRQPNWPKFATKAGNAYHNQLELPILFYVIIIILIMAKENDNAYLYLAWGFVITRVVHALIHLSSIDSAIRFAAFLVSSIILMIMWAILIVNIFT